MLTTNERCMTALRYDPNGDSTDGTGYEISKSVNDRIKVSAPHAEQGASISATR
jgi:hypothetical protein